MPQRGDKRALAETVARNAAEAFTQHKLRRAGDLTARSAALAEIQDALGLDSAPLRIECIDVSHVQGTNVVASLVVFEDGLARKSEYRRFEIRDGAAGGDVASIAEVVRRRFRRYLSETAGDAPRPVTAAKITPTVPVSLPRPRPRTDPVSTPTPGVPASSPTRPTCWSSTAASRRSRRPPTCWPSSASPTSRCAGWPSGWRRCGCRPSRTR